MSGFVDRDNRALFSVSLRSTLNGEISTIEAWIDTAFDGHFVFSSNLIEELGLETLVETDAILADGTKVTLETYVAYLDWFGEQIPVQVVANEGQFPLLGTALLNERRLVIDYRQRTVELS